MTLTINETRFLKQQGLPATVCDQIFSLFMNLAYLKVQRCHEWYYATIERLRFGGERPTFSSSNLTELHVSVHNTDDLLYLLDGRFNRLHTLCVAIHFLDESSEWIEKVYEPIA